MKYLLFFILFFVVELAYFNFADKFGIIDRPNQRSSHSKITLRGGGVIFYIGALAFFCVSKFEYPWFFLGLTLITFISFLDDIYTLSNRIRLFVHFTSILLLAYQLSLFDMTWYYLLIGFIVAVGVVNAYNFMDGINGITACYSLSVGGLLMLINNNIHFINQELLAYVMLSILVFAFFNFRNVAKCFAGDVGSVAIAYILLFALGALILRTGNLIYMLLLSVYGIDAVWTIIRRLFLHENIFKPHRSHLYQILANEVGVNKLIISFSYGLIQFGVGYLVILFSVKSINYQLSFSLILLIVMSIAYLLVKRNLIKNYLK